MVVLAYDLRALVRSVGQGPEAEPLMGQTAPDYLLIWDCFRAVSYYLLTVHIYVCTYIPT